MKSALAARLYLTCKLGYSKLVKTISLTSMSACFDFPVKSVLIGDSDVLLEFVFTDGSKDLL